MWDASSKDRPNANVLTMKEGCKGAGCISNEGNRLVSEREDVRMVRRTRCIAVKRLIQLATIHCDALGFCARRKVLPFRRTRRGLAEECHEIRDLREVTRVHQLERRGGAVPRVGRVLKCNRR